MMPGDVRLDQWPRLAVGPVEEGLHREGRSIMPQAGQDAASMLTALRRARSAWGGGIRWSGAPFVARPMFQSLPG